MSDAVKFEVKDREKKNLKEIARMSVFYFWICGNSDMGDWKYEPIGSLDKTCR